MTESCPCGVPWGALFHVCTTSGTRTPQDARSVDSEPVAAEVAASAVRPPLEAIRSEIEPYLRPPLRALWPAEIQSDRAVLAALAHKYTLPLCDYAAALEQALAEARVENQKLRIRVSLLKRELGATRVNPVKDIIIGMLDQHSDACGACDDAELWLGPTETAKLDRARRKRRSAALARGGATT